MNTERITLVVVGLLLIVGLLATAVPSLFPGGVNWYGAFELLLWATTTLFAATALFWVLLTYVIGAGYESPEPVHGGDEIQVRILTIDSEDVVQATVDSLPAPLDDVRVIAEEPIDVDGAVVHVVPESFACEAVRKGRAIEWARRTLETDREFVLYLDEDSHLESFEGLPDADIVQLHEQPRHTGSALSYLADVYRMGVQIEQRAFARLSIRRSNSRRRPAGTRRPPRSARSSSNAAAGPPATLTRRRNCPWGTSSSSGCATTRGRCRRS